jgi:hypothetical protein
MKGTLVMGLEVMELVLIIMRTNLRSEMMTMHIMECMDTANRISGISNSSKQRWSHE